MIKEVYDRFINNDRARSIPCALNNKKISIKSPELSDLSNKDSSMGSDFSADYTMPTLSSISSDSESFPSLTDSEKSWQRKFRQRAEEVIAQAGLVEGLGLDYIADQIGMDSVPLRKDAALTIVLWVELLEVLQKHLDAETAFKYKTQDAFLDHYKERFAGETGSEKAKLFQFANWMNIIFKMIPVSDCTPFILDTVFKIL